MSTIVGARTASQVRRYVFAVLVALLAGGLLLPPPVVAAPASTAFPLRSGHYFGQDGNAATMHVGRTIVERAAVRRIQSRLQQLKLAPNRRGWVTGRYNAATAAAVGAFQRSRNMRVTRRVDRVTWTTLFAPVPGRSRYNGITTPIFGWDASDFDYERGMRTTNLAAAARDGVRFFTYKITEGTRTVHYHAGEMVRAAQAAGIRLVGVYVVVRTPGNNGHGSLAAQVDFALAELGRQLPEWRTMPGFFFQLDVEPWRYDRVRPDLGVEAGRLLRQRTGRGVAMYAPRWAYGDGIGGTDPLWASNYTASGAPAPFATQWARTAGITDHPGLAPYSGRNPAILQFSSNATIGGQRICDANVSPLTEAALARLVGAR
jgi:peptidoglycan hydrolase-like protein with peptidoglycan-binding domain